MYNPTFTQPGGQWTFSRRFALALALLAPLGGRAVQAAESLDDVAGELIARSEKQAQLFNRGEMQLWLDHIGLGEGFTLMQPFGGPTNHGFDATPERLAELARNFRNGGAAVEIDKTYVSDDMVVLVYVERQDGEVHGLPNQDWSLRVTQVFQRQSGEWKLVHRHADPLVRPISLGKTAALAAGRDFPPEARED